MLVLFETSGGYAIFKVLKEKKLRQPENLYKEFLSSEKANKILKLKHFEKFENVEEALESASCTVQGKMSEAMQKMLKSIFVDKAYEELAVADAKLGSVINSKLNISCVSNMAINELQRGIRKHLDNLLVGFPCKEQAAMTPSSAHRLLRYKLKFSLDKIDKMVVKAVSILDHLDSELNNYIMRCKEWYGWHFPELSKCITEDHRYIKAVLAIGLRENASKCDLSDILSEDEEINIKHLAEISMGIDITEEDLVNIKNLCLEILEMKQCRLKLSEYLNNRMAAIAPNVTSLVGELVGARLIARAGSLVNLAKCPASSVQLLGAEKTLFRAIKSEHDTPKYGLIYHSELIVQSHSELKGKMSRKLAAKATLASRVDAFSEEDCDIGMEHRAKLEQALKILEERKTLRINEIGKTMTKYEKYENKTKVYEAADGSVLTHESEEFQRKRKVDPTDYNVPSKQTKIEEDTQ